MFLETIKKLNLKLERVDVKLTNNMQKLAVKQSIKQQYFNSLGGMGVIKCAVKGIDFIHIFDYLALNLIKDRTNESIWLINQIKEDKDMRNTNEKGSEPPSRNSSAVPTHRDSVKKDTIVKVSKMTPKSTTSDNKALNNGGRLDRIQMS